MYMYIVSQKFFCACEDGWFLMCGKWESCIHDILGSTRDHKHTPLRVTCSTHYCTVTVTSALAFTQFLTEAKGFWLILYIYTQTHTHTHMHIRETDQGKLMSKSPALCRSWSFKTNYKSPLLKPITNLLYPVHTLPPCLFKIKFNSTLPFTSKSFK